MEYKVVWVPLAVETFMEEIDFIYLKWNQKELDDFVMLVDENLKRLSINPLIGQIHKNVTKLLYQNKHFYFIRLLRKIKRSN